MYAIPGNTLQAFAENGTDPHNLSRAGYDSGRGHLTGLAAIGIDLDQVTGRLQQQALDNAQASWDGLDVTARHKLQAHQLLG